MKSKALFLLIAFLLNTVVGFACAIHMDVKPHHHHHQHESCCKSTVNSLLSQAKVVPETVKTAAQIPTLLSGFYHDFTQIYLVLTSTEQQPFADSSAHPPIKDIRIAIQSFQI